jgi:hypothetical protein
MTLVKLDVASARLSTTQIATGEVTVGQLDFKYVVSARLALVTRPHSRHARFPDQ